MEEVEGPEAYLAIYINSGFNHEYVFDIVHLVVLMFAELGTFICGMSLHKTRTRDLLPKGDGGACM
jgi:hypothetical protein